MSMWKKVKWTVKGFALIKGTVNPPWKQLRWIQVLRIMWCIYVIFIIIINNIILLLSAAWSSFGHSVMSDSVTPWTAALQASLSFIITWSLLKFMSPNHLILWHPLLLPSSIVPSIRVFSNDSALPIGWPQFWSCSFSISPSNEYSALISFGVDWFDYLAVQGTLKSLLQHHN